MEFALACLCGARIAKLPNGYSKMAFALACLCGARIAEATNGYAEMANGYSEIIFAIAVHDRGAQQQDVRE
jgi:hypothetical protein